MGMAMGEELGRPTLEQAKDFNVLPHWKPHAGYEFKNDWNAPLKGMDLWGEMASAALPWGSMWTAAKSAVGGAPDALGDLSEHPVFGKFWDALVQDEDEL
jgi:hypothetical protein